MDSSYILARFVQIIRYGERGKAQLVAWAWRGFL